jgi:hypothetical protein
MADGGDLWGCMQGGYGMVVIAWWHGWIKPEQKEGWVGGDNDIGGPYES